MSIMRSRARLLGSAVADRVLMVMEKILSWKIGMEIENILKKSWHMSLLLTAYHESSTRSVDNSIPISLLQRFGYGRLEANHIFFTTYFQFERKFDFLFA